MPDQGQLAASYDPQAGKLPGLPAPEAGTAAPGDGDHSAKGRERRALEAGRGR